MTGPGFALAEAFGADRVRQDVVLSDYTTFRVGGPADWLIETRSSGEIIQALEIARDSGMPATILGGGSNVLVADPGVRGLVIRPRGGEVRAGRGAFARMQPSRQRTRALTILRGMADWRWLT